MPAILVVAAEESRRRLVNILRRAGYSVAEADSAETALKIASSLAPKLILMAIVMDESNGLELAAKMRRESETESTPIVLLGSITPIGMEDEPLASLVSGYLDIDAPSNDLLATVRSQLTANP